MLSLAALSLLANLLSLLWTPICLGQATLALRSLRSQRPLTRSLNLATARGKDAWPSVFLSVSQSVSSDDMPGMRSSAARLPHFECPRREFESTGHRPYRDYSGLYYRFIRVLGWE